MWVLSAYISDYLFIKSGEAVCVFIPGADPGPATPPPNTPTLVLKGEMLKQDQWET